MRRRSFLTRAALAVLALAAGGARAVPALARRLPRSRSPRVRLVRAGDRTLVLPEEFLKTYRPAIWVRGKGRIE